LIESERERGRHIDREKEGQSKRGRHKERERERGHIETERGENNLTYGVNDSRRCLTATLSVQV
jgi:hypothetical protein